MKNKQKIALSEVDKWKGFPKYFSVIDEKDSITTDNYLDVIRMYREAGREKIIVRHMHYSGKAKLKSFTIGFDGELKSLSIWRDSGGFGAWDPALVKLVDRPKRKRAAKKKATAKKKAKAKAPPKSTPARIIKRKKKPPTSCKEHPNYGAIRSPRTDCKSCWKLYYNKHPEKK